MWPGVIFSTSLAGGWDRPAGERGGARGSSQGRQGCSTPQHQYHQVRAMVGAARCMPGCWRRGARPLCTGGTGCRGLSPVLPTERSLRRGLARERGAPCCAPGSCPPPGAGCCGQQPPEGSWMGSVGSAQLLAALGCRDGKEQGQALTITHPPPLRLPRAAPGAQQRPQAPQAVGGHWFLGAQRDARVPPAQRRPLTAVLTSPPLRSQ